MLRRKIEDTLREWKNTPGHLPLVIMGLRQCGARPSLSENSLRTIIGMSII